MWRYLLVLFLGLVLGGDENWWDNIKSFGDGEAEIWSIPCSDDVLLVKTSGLIGRLIVNETCGMNLRWCLRGIFIGHKEPFFRISEGGDYLLIADAESLDIVDLRTGNATNTNENLVTNLNFFNIYVSMGFSVAFPLKMYTWLNDTHFMAAALLYKNSSLSLTVLFPCDYQANCADHSLWANLNPRDAVVFAADSGIFLTYAVLGNRKSVVTTYGVLVKTFNGTSLIDICSITSSFPKDQLENITEVHQRFIVMKNPYHTQVFISESNNPGSVAECRSLVKLPQSLVKDEHVFTACSDVLFIGGFVNNVLHVNATDIHGNLSWNRPFNVSSYITRVQISCSEKSVFVRLFRGLSELQVLRLSANNGYVIAKFNLPVSHTSVSSSSDVTLVVPKYESVACVRGPLTCPMGHMIREDFGETFLPTSCVPCPAGSYSGHVSSNCSSCTAQNSICPVGAVADINMKPDLKSRTDVTPPHSSVLVFNSGSLVASSIAHQALKTQALWIALASFFVAWSAFIIVLLASLRVTRLRSAVMYLRLSNVRFRRAASLWWRGLLGLVTTIVSITILVLTVEMFISYSHFYEHLDKQVDGPANLIRSTATYPLSRAKGLFPPEHPLDIVEHSVSVTIQPALFGKWNCSFESLQPILMLPRKNESAPVDVSYSHTDEGGKCIFESKFSLHWNDAMSQQVKLVLPDKIYYQVLLWNVSVTSFVEYLPWSQENPTTQVVVMTSPWCTSASVQEPVISETPSLGIVQDDSVLDFYPQTKRWSTTELAANVPPHVPGNCSEAKIRFSNLMQVTVFNQQRAVSLLEVALVMIIAVFGTLQIVNLAVKVPSFVISSVLALHKMRRKWLAAPSEPTPAGSVFEELDSFAASGFDE